MIGFRAEGAVRACEPARRLGDRVRARRAHRRRTPLAPARGRAGDRGAGAGRRPAATGRRGRASGCRPSGAAVRPGQRAGAGVTEGRLGGLMLAPTRSGALLLFLVPAQLSFALAMTDADLLTSPRLRRARELPRARGTTLLQRGGVAVGAVRRGRRAAAAGDRDRLRAAAARAVPGRRTGAHGGVPAERDPRQRVRALWLFLLNPVYGPINGLLGLVGIAPVSWFSGGEGAFAAIVLMLGFTVGEAFIVALAARQELPAELYSSPAWRARAPGTCCGPSRCR